MEFIRHTRKRRQPIARQVAAVVALVALALVSEGIGSVLAKVDTGDKQDSNGTSNPHDGSSDKFWSKVSYNHFKSVSSNSIPIDGRAGDNNDAIYAMANPLTGDKSVVAAEVSSIAYYQPTLIGFRCEGAHDVNEDGVSVIEANRPISMTLYGKSFTTSTIVAFTTEFQPDHQLELELLRQHTTNASPSTPPTGTTSQSTSASTESFTDKSLDDEAGVRRQFASRRRVISASFDCTDYNRVVSYKLTEKNILSNNVAILTVALPELDPGSGQYYYFCIKQPRLGALNSGSATSGAPSPGHFNESLVWVHQGDEWWVTLKVEPPILSITNDCVLIVLLLFLSAVTSGLNLGLMSLDMNELAVISSCGDQRERSYARTIAPLRKRGNYLLCSLLLGNVMVNSTLTVILEEMTSGLVAVIGSTLAIVVLGEIVPQALCARQGLAIGARTIYLTYAFMLLTFPLSYPIACMLDWTLGEEKGNVYDRERLMEFIKITGHHTQLEADEVAIISGALKLKKVKVDQIMTRIEDVFMLPLECKLDRETIRRIIEKGYSRIPVYEFGDRKQIVALILAKDLALIDPDDHTPVANMLRYCRHPLIFIQDDTTLDVALNEFKTGKSHMAVVRQIYDDGETDKYYEAIGVVTLEDVIEEVLQAEINDETDSLSDNRRKRRRTDAQVVPMLDELALVGLQSGAPSPKLPGTNGNQQQLSQSALSKEVQTSLASHLDSIAIMGAGGQAAIQLLPNSSDNPANQAQPEPASEIQSGLTSSLIPDSQQQPPETAEDASVLGRAAQFLSHIMP